MLLARPPPAACEVHHAIRAEILHRIGDRGLIFEQYFTRAR